MKDENSAHGYTEGSDIPNSHTEPIDEFYLKPCPFCGGEATIKPIKSGYLIKCTACHIEKKQRVLKMPLEWLHGEMIKDWNERESSPVSVDINREWIDRNKQMPEPHVQVLINIQYGMGNRSYALSYCTKRFPDIFDHFSDGIITHWMPLPEHPALSKASPPKQNENENESCS